MGTTITASFPLLRLLDAAEARARVTPTRQKVVYRDPNLKKKEATSVLPSFNKYMVNEMMYNGAKNAIHTLLDRCESKPASVNPCFVHPYGTNMTIAHFDTKKRCWTHELNDIAHGTRVDAQIQEWCELISSCLSSDNPDPSLTIQNSPKHYMETAGAYLSPDYDVCSLHITQFIWEKLRMIPMEAQFPVYDDDMMLATEIDQLATSRDDIGERIGVLEFKCSKKVSIKKYLGLANPDGVACRNEHMVFTSSGCKSLHRAGELLGGMPDSFLTRDMLQLMLSVSILITKYGVNQGVIDAYLVKACSDGLVCIRMDESMYIKLPLLRSIMVEYDAVKKPNRKEARKEQILRKFKDIQAKNKILQSRGLRAMPVRNHPPTQWKNNMVKNPSTPAS